jgi:type II secretory pathway pseudopilin PulG
MAPPPGTLCEVPVGPEMKMQASRKQPGAARAARRGVTLAEVLVSLGLVALSTAVFGTFVPAVGRSMGRAHGRDIATEACQKQLETYRANGYQFLPSSGGSFLARTTFTPSVSLQNAVGTASFTPVDANMQPTSGDTGRVRVDVTVSWNAGGGDRGSATLTTVIVR